MANKNVEGLWIVTGVNKRHDGTEYKSKSRVCTTNAGLKQAISAAKNYFLCVRVEVEEYTVQKVEK